MDTQKHSASGSTTQKASATPIAQPQNQKKENVEGLSVAKRNGLTVAFDLNKILICINRACAGLSSSLQPDAIAQEVIRNIYHGIATADIEKALLLSVLPFIEKDPDYSFVAARLFLQKLYREAIAKPFSNTVVEEVYRETFVSNIKKGIRLGFMDKRLLEFDLEYLASHLKRERDYLFTYLGIATLYEKYLLKDKGARFELPQAFLMRVAMGLALLEEHKNEKAVEFYNLLSSLRFVSSTPTLLHSGLARPQLSSCFLSTVTDDLHHIFKCVGDNAQLSKWSGGVANDWTDIRATGALIKSVNIGSQGVIPFLKIANDVTAAISRSGSRRGATVVYLETWHLDIEDFLDLRRNTGDERRRTHDMNTANWIPDLFMQRVQEDGDWTLFSPEEVPDLHHMYGQKFKARYEIYESMAAEGRIKKYKTIKAKELWKRMLSRLFETGHPWIVFKDACNVRSPQDHVGVVHSSNLCTEITLNTSAEETAVCNLGSINLSLHIKDGSVDKEGIASTVHTAMRMLDNVVDINFYPTKEAKNANMKHRPVGLGMMGVQDALFKLDLAFDSQEALEAADELAEHVSYNAILASSKLAKERGTYTSYKGSKWDRGIFPIDTIELLEKERGARIDIDRKERLDWEPVRKHVKQHGMRNSNTMAVAPTATISNISGCFPCIEPIYKNIYVKANMSGEFTIINHYLVEDLKKLGLWSHEMLDLVKYYDGDISLIPQIPDHLKRKYQTAFDIDPLWLIKITATRSKWIDQSQSHNVFMKGVSGKKLSDIYMNAWMSGLKSTYYLRTLGASQIEKSTLDAKKFGFTQKRVYNESSTATKTAPKACRIEDPECEACQ